MVSDREAELLRKIQELEMDQRDARSKLAKLKKEFLDVETQLINCTLDKEKLVEELRLFRKHSVDQELSAEELEVERFREVYLDLLKKV